MKDEYDFSKGERGKFYRPDTVFNPPVHLDAEVRALPTLDELRARLEQRPGVTPSVRPAEAVRAERDRQ
jgi:hypothetical protein